MGVWNWLENFFSGKERARRKKAEQQLYIAASLAFVLIVIVVGALYLYHPAWKAPEPEALKSSRLVREMIQEGKVTFNNKAVTFEQNTAEIKNDSIGQIVELATALADPKLKKIPFFYIDGHTCDLGSEKRNCQLSIERACATKQLLAKHAGIEKERIKVRGFGESCPIKPNDSEANREQNRRVVVRSSKETDPGGKACVQCKEADTACQ
jgi:outer membrane protein OmpA-like peptidoglycan-associated protein